ncbi:MAG: O-antigen ligase family protein [Verrucomicrobia bacterium]|nr:O-antigen ligase family protein [Verrucomicrobiota bacterium]
MGASAPSSSSGSAQGSSSRRQQTGPPSASYLQLARYLWPALPLLAVALGGATTRPAQAVVLLVLGALLLWRPPSCGAGWGLNIVCLGFLLLGAASLLPAAWFGRAATVTGSAWRGTLVEDFGLPLPATASPQPWLTLDGLVLLLAGLCWLLAQFSQAWTDGERRTAARTFVLGAALLAAVSIGAKLRGVEPPGWHAEYHFGPFPNRNQTANFFVLAALLALACARHEFRAGRWARGLGWGAALAALAQAIFLTYSRAGVAMLFAGACLFALLATTRRRNANAAPMSDSTLAPSPPPPTRASRRLPALAVGISISLLLLTGFFLFGGDTLRRFQPGEGKSLPGAATAAVAADFRWRIQADALAMDRTLPACGLGIGNFSAVFALFREQSANVPARCRHPESDWLWLWSELGWMAIVLAVAGVELLAMRLLAPRKSAAPKTSADRSLRLAALLGLGAFLAHSFVEVSTHRIATALAAIFVFGLALPPAAKKPSPHAASVRWLFRAAGLLLLGVGAGWCLAARSGAAWPGLLGVENLKTRATAAMAAHDYPTVVRLTTEALAIAPLDYQLYFGRALAEVSTGSDDEADRAADDFRRARELEQLNVGLPVHEAAAWLAADNGTHAARALPALDEAYRREPATGARTFSLAVAASLRPPLAMTAEGEALRGGLELLARRHPALLLTFLENLAPLDALPRLAQAWQHDAELAQFNDSEKRTFFRLWIEKGGDLDKLTAALENHPSWQPLGWRAWATGLAQAGEDERACALAARFVPAPKLPPLLDPSSPSPTSGGRTLEQLQQAFQSSRAALTPGLELLRAQLDAKDRPGALLTLTELTARPGAPAYLFYLLARLHGEAHAWPQAWAAWQRFCVETQQPD